MPKINEWVIPKNIDKPIETVYEIKNEYDVHSFEEFMKDYKADENLNYDDLSDISVGEIKGYGPCYDRCNWANPDCECYLRQKCVPLHLVCPAPKTSWPYCTNKTPGPFYHGGCGDGRSYIDTDLYIRCMKPGCGEKVHIRNVVFACSTHRGDHSKASKEAFGNALSVLNSAWKGKSYAISKCIEKMIDKLMDEDGLL